MRKDEQKESNWTNRKRWSPRNQGTYGFGSDSNDVTDVGARTTAPEEETPERWHNREFYGESRGYTTMLEAGLPEHRGIATARHHVSPSSHARWDRSIHSGTQRHGWSRAFDGGSRAGSGAGLHAGKGPKNYRRSDERIFEEVCERLMQHPEIDASDIEVRVAAGEVTLSGTVPDRQTKRLAEDVLEGVPGLNDISNELRIG